MALTKPKLRSIVDLLADEIDTCTRELEDALADWDTASEDRDPDGREDAADRAADLLVEIDKHVALLRQEIATALQRTEVPR